MSRASFSRPSPGRDTEAIHCSYKSGLGAGNISLRAAMGKPGKGTRPCGFRPLDVNFLRLFRSIGKQDNPRPFYLQHSAGNGEVAGLPLPLGNLHLSRGKRGEHGGMMGENAQVALLTGGNEGNDASLIYDPLRGEDLKRKWGHS